jgi:hypothetical protein
MYNIEIIMDKNTKFYIIYLAIIIVITIVIFLYEYYKPKSNFFSVVYQGAVETPVVNTYQYGVYYSALSSSPTFQSSGLTQYNPILLTGTTGPGSLNPATPANGIAAITTIGIFNVGPGVFNSNGLSLFYTMGTAGALPMAVSTSLVTTQSADTVYIGGRLSLPVNSVLRISNVNSSYPFQRLILACNNLSDSSIILYFYDSSKNYRELQLLTVSKSYLELDFFY